MRIIIGVLLVSAVVYAVFGTWGGLVPAVVLGAVIALVLRRRSVVFGKKSTEQEASAIEFDPFYIFDAEMDVDNLAITITYHDLRGETTERTVSIQKIGLAAGHLYIRGFCHHAGRGRTFQVDRILSATVDGKPVEPMAHIASLCKDNPAFNKHHVL